MNAPILSLDLETLRARTSAKWVQYPPDVIPAWVAEMDVLLPEPVVAALTHAFETGDTGYPRPPHYVSAFAGFAARQWAWRVAPGATALTPDVMTGILVLVLKVTDPGDSVVINDPVYPPFESFPKLAGREVIRAALNPEGRLDLETLAVAFRAATAGGRRAAYLLCSPHNPTGAVHTAAELEAVAALAAQTGVAVIADEIHAPLVYAGTRFTPYLTLPGIEHGYAVHSAAKAFSLAGVKAGLVVSARADRGTLGDLAWGPGASLSGTIAHAAAWNHGEAWLARLVAELQANRDLAVSLLAERLPEVAVTVPEATYLMWLDCRGLGLGDDPAAAFLERGRVALSSGIPFGPAGVGHCRLNFATSPAILTEIVDRMARAVRPA